MKHLYPSGFIHKTKQTGGSPFKESSKAGFQIAVICLNRTGIDRQTK